jgi:hypothetical protein
VRSKNNQVLVAISRDQASYVAYGIGDNFESIGYNFFYVAGA